MRSSRSSETVRWFRPMTTTDTPGAPMGSGWRRPPVFRLPPYSRQSEGGMWTWNRSRRWRRRPGRRAGCSLGGAFEGVGAHRARAVGATAVEAEDLQLDGEIDLAHRHIGIEAQHTRGEVQDRADAGRHHAL